jgi:hypothetical protein
MAGTQVVPDGPDDGAGASVPSSGSKGGSEVRYNEKLSSKVMAAYGCFRLPISAYDLGVRPARTAVYVEALNQSLLVHAMIVALCKSLDFLLGFMVRHPAALPCLQFSPPHP